MMNNLLKEKRKVRKYIIIITHLFLAGVFLYGWLKTVSLASKKIREKEKAVEKNKQYYNLYNHWIEMKNKGQALDDFFVRNNYKSIAIYGMGDVGMQLAREMEYSKNVDVKYVIDKNIYADKVIFEKKELNMSLPKVDAIVVTPIFAYEKIANEIKNFVDYPVISIEEVVYSM